MPVESATIRLERKPTDLAEVWGGAWADLEPLRRGRHATLDGPPPGACPPCSVDPFRLGQVFRNLFDNALKFTPKGGAIRLEVGQEFGSGVESGLRFLRVSLIDTGRGIPAEQLPYIFDPFRQVERSDARQGFGMGLAIAQRLVAAHQGRIQAQSQPGFGTSFTVLLPC